MRTMTSALDAICRQQAGAVLRVRLDRAGLAELSAAGGYDGAVTAILLDAAGEPCGRARRLRSPAQRYAPHMEWYLQVGGCIESRAWAGMPMGCGSGVTPHEAALACMDDLRSRARDLDAQASRVELMLAGGR